MPIGSDAPVTVGIIGIAGAYGRWLERFFRQAGCTVIGADRSLPRGDDSRSVVERADVVVFSVPLDQTVGIIEQLVDVSRPDQLWIDITSIKAAPIAAMLKSRAEVVGLHPMCAPTVETWKGQIVVACAGRPGRWMPWLLEILAWSGATIEWSTPEEHDRYVAIVQALPHAVSLILAATLRDTGVDIHKALRFMTPVARLMWATLNRILSLNPALYADIQISNAAETVAVLRQLRDEAEHFRDVVEHADRRTFQADFAASRAFIGAPLIDEGAALFEQLIRFSADLSEANSVIIRARHDYPGLLFDLLSVFREAQINLTSLHSFKVADGYRFQIGLDTRRSSPEVQAALKMLRAHAELGDNIEIVNEHA